MYAFKMPALGAEMAEGTLLEWRVKEGDSIRAHDIIAVIDTDKAAIEAESFRSGIVEKLVVKPGEKVPVGTVLAFISESGEKLQSFEESKKQPAAQKEQVPGARHPSKVKISPLAKKTAKELGVDISKITGTGPEGSVVEADIKKAASRLQPLVDHAATMKKAIAAAMARSKREIPHYYLSYEIDLNNALSWLQKYNSEHLIKDRVLYAALLVRAVSQALKKHPEFNGFFIDEEFHQSGSVHIGFAISLRGGGLIAPALLNADTLNLSDTMKNLTDLVSRTRNGKLRDREISDPTVTITNLGDFGVDSVFGVIYPPQVALIGFGKITSKNTMTATLSADHRVSNGLSGSRLLTTINKILQDPEKLL